jgi:hypothetical protein
MAYAAKGCESRRDAWRRIAPTTVMATVAAMMTTMIAAMMSALVAVTTMVRIAHAIRFHAGGRLRFGDTQAANE